MPRPKFRASACTVASLLYGRLTLRRPHKRVGVRDRRARRQRWYSAVAGCHTRP